MFDRAKLTPMMQQWFDCKQEAKDSVLLFRMGDFYEAFYEDAEILARDLGLTLTKRSQTPMAGVPVQSLDSICDRLVAKKRSVAIAEQLEDPAMAKGLVKRGIVRTVSPGSLLNSNLLLDKRNNFFAALSQVGSVFGLSFMDVSTSEFRCIELDSSHEVLAELARIRPAEILCSKKFEKRHAELLKSTTLATESLIHTQDDWTFELEGTHKSLTEHFGVLSLEGFGLGQKVVATQAAGALLMYLKKRRHLSLEHVRQLRTYSTQANLQIDAASQRNLDLTEGPKGYTLLDVLDHTYTAMGARLLRSFVVAPLLDLAAIAERHDAVEELCKRPDTRAELSQLLSRLRDIERLSCKVLSRYATPRDVQALAMSLLLLPEIKQALSSCENSLLTQQIVHLGGFEELASDVLAALQDELPAKLSDGNIFRDGYYAPLDEARSLSKGALDWMTEYQERLREETGLSRLKVSFTRAFGYYIEVPTQQARSMPESFTRKQTLTNCERFTSPELKAYEDKVLSAEEDVRAFEVQLFEGLRQKLAEHAFLAMKASESCALVDVMQSLAHAACQYGYTRPQMHTGYALNLTSSRHPVVERHLAAGAFVENDCTLDEESRLIVLTGPNMAGKSTYIRQVALLSILAQMGSFVPAQSANLPLVDKIFTRIGASDDVARGQSTFMVEMLETANILNNCTSRSLVILDEIGRGTSTYDGIAIAWSVAEYLLLDAKKRAKTLFATHYFELTELATCVPGAANSSVAVTELAGQIHFLHKIVPGFASSSSEKAYGIQVAKLAGLPLAVIERAEAILPTLGHSQGKLAKPERKTPAKIEESQLCLFDNF